MTALGARQVRITWAPMVLAAVVRPGDTGVMSEDWIEKGGRPTAAVVQSVFILTLLWTALFLAWQSLRVFDFLYPLWYEVLDIREHIAHYGPQNEYKSDFEATSDADRFLLFGAIVDAVTGSGEGLQTLTYQDRSGASVGLLREPERVHLQSVANLLDRLRAFSYSLLAVLLLAAALLWRLGIPLPPPRRVTVSAMLAFTAAGLAVLAAGAERVFNALHRQVFPAGEQWYFYYEESLMSTMMKAPDLFGAIAVTLLLVALCWCALLLFAARRFLMRG